MGEDFDLFGLPVRVGQGKRGRPAFVVTPEKVNKIKLGLALGWSNERLASAIACSLPTLKRYFRAELQERDMARDQLELQRFHLVMGEASKGNIGALRELGRMIEKNDAMNAAARMGAAQGKPKEGKAAEKPAKPLGKKEAAQAAAREVAGGGSSWLGDLTPGFTN